MFRVTPDVLIPRPETELIVDEVRARDWRSRTRACVRPGSSISAPEADVSP